MYILTIGLQIWQLKIMYLCRKRLSKGFLWSQACNYKGKQIKRTEGSGTRQKKERGQNQSVTFSNAPSCIGFANVNSHIWVDVAKVLLFPEFCKFSPNFLQHHGQSCVISHRKQKSAPRIIQECAQPSIKMNSTIFL